MTLAQTLAQRAELQKPDVGPVQLCYSDASLWIQPGKPTAMQHMERFETTEEALQRACALAQTGKFFTPFIALDDSELTVTFGTTELLHEIKLRTA
jgi:hypothetical protein